MKLPRDFLKKFVVILPPLLLAVQAVDYLFSGYLSYIRAFILFSIVIPFSFRRVKSFDTISYLILLFLAYTLIISFKSSDYSVTIPGYLSIYVSMSFYIVAYNVFQRQEDFQAFKALLYLVPAVFIVNVALHAAFGIGEGVYGGKDVLKIGPGLHHNTIYTGVLIIVLSFGLLKYSKHKTIDIIFLATMTIIILLSFRRTAIILMVVCYLIYILLSRKREAVKYILPSLVILISAYPLYEEPLKNVIKARGHRATFERGIERESRYLEIKIITKRSLSFRDPNYSLFGMEFLNSFGTYGCLAFPVVMRRILHTDYAVILHGAGLAGFGIYFVILAAFLVKIVTYVRVLGPSHDMTIICLCFFSVLALSMFSGGLLNITYRTSLFIFLGSAARISDGLVSARSHIQPRKQ